MFRILLPLALLAAPASAFAQEADPELTLEQQMLLRCSVTFAVVAGAQDRGDAQALEYAPLEDTGREFFVRSMARVMDETGLTTEQVERLVLGEVEAIMDAGSQYDLMPVCLPLLPE